MKVPDGGCMDGVLARTAIQTSDGQACMSMEADRPECEYWRRSRESQRLGGIDFHSMDGHETFSTAG